MSVNVFLLYVMKKPMMNYANALMVMVCHGSFFIVLIA